MTQPSKPPLHPLFQAAQASVIGDLDPWLPPHLGGPVPRVPKRAQAELAVWAAEQILDQLSEEDQQVLRLCRRLLAGECPEGEFEEGGRVRSAIRRGYRARVAGVPREVRSKPWMRFETPADVVGCALGACLKAPGSWRTAGKAAAKAVHFAARLLSSDEERLLLLDELDQRLMVHEVQPLLLRRASTLVRAVRFRAPSRGGFCGLWVVELQRTWGTLYRKRGLQFVEGTFDDALATVPDALFPQVVARVGTRKA